MYAKLIKNFFRTWRHHATMQIATLTVLAGTYTVVTLSLLVHQNLEMILTQWGDEVEMSVYLEDGASDADISKVKTALNETKMFSSMAFVSKEEAIKRFKTQMAGYAPTLLEDTKFNNPLPSSLELKLKNGLSSDRQYKGLVEVAAAIEKSKGVDEVSYGQGWVENYASVIQSFSLTSYILIFVLLSGSLFVVGNSIRNSISQRREEIEILELVGATKNLIRLPYIFEGVIMGIMAGLMSLLFCYFIYSWQTSLMSSKLSFWSFTTELESLSFWRSVLVVFVGGAFGALGSLLCAAKISTGWAAAQASEGWSEK